VLALGSDIGKGMPGEPAYYAGRVTDTAGTPIANCCVDVWSGDGEGVYDMQKDGDAGMQLRARFHTDAQGQYRFWSIKPTYYPVPDDGPVGDMLRAMGRHPNRPGHIHMKVYAEGYAPLTTHLFAADSPYLDSDAVFGVRDSLIVHYEKHAPGSAPDGRVLDKSWHSAHYDFKLAEMACSSAATASRRARSALPTTKPSSCAASTCAATWSARSRSRTTSGSSSPARSPIRSPAVCSRRRWSRLPSTASCRACRPRA
jgi:protocatechuate 3,4-dioxygenase beta subunit